MASTSTKLSFNRNTLNFSLENPTSVATDKLPYGYFFFQCNTGTSNTTISSHTYYGYEAKSILIVNGEMTYMAQKGNVAGYEGNGSGSIFHQIQAVNRIAKNVTYSYSKGSNFPISSLNTTSAINGFDNSGTVTLGSLDNLPSFLNTLLPMLKKE